MLTEYKIILATSSPFGGFCLTHARALTDIFVCLGRTSKTWENSLSYVEKVYGRIGSLLDRWEALEGEIYAIKCGKSGQYLELATPSLFPLCRGPRIDLPSLRLSSYDSSFRISFRRPSVFKTWVVRMHTAHGHDWESARIAAMASAYAEGRLILFGKCIDRRFCNWLR